MLEITATLLLIIWALGLFSGSALGAAAYVLPMLALTAIVLRVYDSARSKAHAKARPRMVHTAAAHSPQSVPPAGASDGGGERHAEAA